MILLLLIILLITLLYNVFISLFLRERINITDILLILIIGKIFVYIFDIVSKYEYKDFN
jgi:hypothetical protein